MSATKEHYHNQIEQEIRIASQSPVAIEKMAEEYAEGVQSTTPANTQTIAPPPSPGGETEERSEPVTCNKLPI